MAWDLAQAQQGRFLLRIEDIDTSRARPAWEAQIFDDLAWLGLHWPEPVKRQAQDLSPYRSALENLWSRGLLYVCTCKRRDVLEAASAPQEGAPPLGPDGIVYPGTCRARPKDAATPLPADAALRLDLRACAAVLPDTITFEETGNGAPRTGWIATPLSDLFHRVGDAVLCRQNMGTSYHLSVVLDDAEQGITDVVRGADLFDATAFHVVIQRLLDLPTPRYHHHRLIRDDHGKRLAKRDDARAISTYRDAGAMPQDIRRMVGLG